MSADNVEIVKRVFAAFESGDHDELLSLLDDDVDWGASAYLTGEGNQRGKVAVRRWLHDVASLQGSGEHVETFQAEYRDLDEHTVLVLGGGRILREEGMLEEEVGWIWRIEDDKVVRMTDYLSHAEALEAAKALE